MRPRFITLEGGEGAGKSTQLKRLAKAFTEAGIPIITTREPGGSVGAEVIRQLLVTGAENRWDATTESLLFMTARYDHIHQTIKPALAHGTWVLCDRFFDSTYVYQGIAKGVDGLWLKQLYHLLYGDFGPDITMLLDLPPEEGLKRAASRAGNETRFEQMDIGFHGKLREGFLRLAKAEPQRIHTIDASRDPITVHSQIIAQINTIFSLALTPHSS